MLTVEPKERPRHSTNSSPSPPSHHRSNKGGVRRRRDSYIQSILEWDLKMKEGAAVDNPIINNLTDLVRSQSLMTNEEVATSLLTRTKRPTHQINACSAANTPTRPQLGGKMASVIHPAREVLGDRQEQEGIGSRTIALRVGIHGDDLVDIIRKSVIGSTSAMWGPFGQRRITYADYTASGRSLSFVESYIRDVVLPTYANSHTETSCCGAQTTMFVEESRDIIISSVNARPSEDAVVFCGSGCTGAIAKLVAVLGIRLPSQLEDTFHLSQYVPEEARPVVFVGPYEHHSNEIMWRETLATVVAIDEDTSGNVDLIELEKALKKYQNRSLLIGSFSAGSNVTGIVAHVVIVSRLLQRYGALAFWDYAGSGAYVTIDMNPADDVSIDAIFMSPHKMIGGPGTPGVLVAKRTLFKNRVPTIPGGGTVAFVNSKEHMYEGDPENIEEGGTPAIMANIRAGVVFHLKDVVGCERIEQLEHSFARRLADRLHKHPNIKLMGSERGDFWLDSRLSITSFVITHKTSNGQTVYLHHHFIAQILNDIYGLQARSGCSCAGPYSERLFGRNHEHNDYMFHMVQQNMHFLKIGWTRVNINYFVSEDEFEFIVSAIEQVASYAWKMLPLYRIDLSSGMWYHRRFSRDDGLRFLAEFMVDDIGRVVYKAPSTSIDDPAIYLKEAMKHYEHAEEYVREIGFTLNPALPDCNVKDGQTPCWSPETAEHIWFLLPTEAAQQLGYVPPTSSTPDNTLHRRINIENTNEFKCERKLATHLRESSRKLKHGRPRG